MIYNEHLKNYDNFKLCFSLFTFHKKIAVNCLTFEDFKCFLDNYKLYSNSDEPIIKDRIINSNKYNHRICFFIEANLSKDNLELKISDRQNCKEDLGFTIINFDSFLHLNNMNNFCLENKKKFILSDFKQIEYYYFKNINNKSINDKFFNIKNNDFGFGI